MNKKSKENNLILAAEWEKFFAQREKLFGVKMTTEQKEGWKNSSTIVQAEKALELRQDLKRIYDKNNFSRQLAQQLEYYLQPEAENIEAELINNNGDDLLAAIKEEISNHGEHYQLETLARWIREGYYDECPNF